MKTNEQYFAVGAIAVFALALSAAATARIPIALILFFGSAAAIGTAFLVDAGNVVLP